MQLRRLTALEVDKLRDELSEIQGDIAQLKKLLASETKQRNLVRDELRELVARFGASRRSTVVNAADLVVIEDDVEEIEEELFRGTGRSANSRYVVYLGPARPTVARGRIQSQTGTSRCGGS